ncbi:hypothetical protein ACFQE5_04390 [Pseudonocardia hispaniensis]|uniref:Sporulation and spore germination protein n=1 Tax=Pseudonocardia hispaniensis TaxID=904933 RepID=A0ABW1IY61_9PSEU
MWLRTCGRILLAVLLGSVLVACAGSPLEPGASGAPGAGTEGGAATPVAEGLVVRRGDHELLRLDVDGLRALPQVEAATAGTGKGSQRGPTVRAVLDRAGVGAVTTVTVEGRDPTQTLTAADLTDRLVLDLTARGTVKLAGPDLPRERWVRDVTALVVPE